MLVTVKDGEGIIYQGLWGTARDHLFVGAHLICGGGRSMHRAPKLVTGLEGILSPKKVSDPPSFIELEYWILEKRHPVYAKVNKYSVHEVTAH